MANRTLARLLFLVILPLSLLLGGCGVTDSPSTRELILQRYELSLPSNTTGLFRIREGNGSYKATSSDETVATAFTSSANPANVYVRTLRSGTVTITVSDAAGKTAELTLTVTSNPIALTLDQNVDGYQIITGKTRVVVIMTGNGSYVVESSNPSVVKATLHDDQISLKGLSAGESTIKITDAEGQMKEFSVTVSDVVSIQLDASQKKVAVSGSRKINVLYGNGSYSVSSEDEAVATATVSNTRITVSGIAEGKTNIVVTDKAGAEAKIAVDVYNAPWAAKLYTTYFQVPSFDTPSPYSSLTNCTFECFVCMDESGFLNTVMGLEGTFLIRQNGGRFNLYTLDGEISSTTYINYGEWYYVAATFDGVNKVTKLYINGVEEGSRELRSSTLDLGRTAGTQGSEYEHFMVGMACEQRRFLYGSIGEIRVWSRTLTDYEIAANCLGISVDPDSEGLVAYWKLNENTDLLEIPDHSGNGNVGIPNAAVKQWTPLAFP